MVSKTKGELGLVSQMALLVNFSLSLFRRYALYGGQRKLNDRRCYDTYIQTDNRSVHYI